MPLTEKFDAYIDKDKKYMINAIPTTTSKFDPSGSFTNKKNSLEHMRAVTPRMSNVIFFDLKYIFT
jgi:hypothetical protein